MRKSSVILSVILSAVFVFIFGGLVLVRYLNSQLGVTGENEEKILSERQQDEEQLHKKLAKIEETERTEEKRESFVASLNKEQKEEKFDVRVASEMQEEAQKKTEKFDPTSSLVSGRGDSLLFLGFILSIGWAFYNYFLREEVSEEEKKKREEEKRQQEQQPPPPEQ
ncbi:MAG: hypothetical protein V1746_06390 [bacterium]